MENRNLTAESIGAKSCVLDVRAMLKDETRVNIKVQLRNLDDFDRRSLFYWGILRRGPTGPRFPSGTCRGGYKDGQSNNGC